MQKYIDEAFDEITFSRKEKVSSMDVLRSIYSLDEYNDLISDFVITIMKNRGDAILKNSHSFADICFCLHGIVTCYVYLGKLIEISSDVWRNSTEYKFEDKSFKSKLIKFSRGLEKTIDDASDILDEAKSRRLKAQKVFEESGEMAIGIKNGFVRAQRRIGRYAFLQKISKSLPHKQQSIYNRICVKSDKLGDSEIADTIVRVNQLMDEYIEILRKQSQDAYGSPNQNNLTDPDFGGYDDDEECSLMTKYEKFSSVLGEEKIFEKIQLINEANSKSQFTESCFDISYLISKCVIKCITPDLSKYEEADREAKQYLNEVREKISVKMAQIKSIVKATIMEVAFVLSDFDWCDSISDEEWEDVVSCYSGFRIRYSKIQKCLKNYWGIIGPSEESYSGIIKLFRRICESESFGCIYEQGNNAFYNAEYVVPSDVKKFSSFASNETYWENISPYLCLKEYMKFSILMGGLLNVVVSTFDGDEEELREKIILHLKRCARNIVNFKVDSGTDFIQISGYEYITGLLYLDDANIASLTAMRNLERNLTNFSHSEGWIPFE